MSSDKLDLRRAFGPYTGGNILHYSFPFHSPLLLLLVVFITLRFVSFVSRTIQRNSLIFCSSLSSFTLPVCNTEGPSCDIWTLLVARSSGTFLQTKNMTNVRTLAGLIAGSICQNTIDSLGGDGWGGDEKPKKKSTKKRMIPFRFAQLLMCVHVR